MSETITWVRTCKACGHDNPENAKRCNSCAKNLTGGMTDRYIRRWACPKCSTLNMADNTACLCSFTKGSADPGFLGWMGIIFVGLFILSKCGQ